MTGSDILWRASYSYAEEKPPPKDPKRNRHPDGKVKIMPRNAYSNSGVKVIDSYFKPLKHLDDPYDRAHQFAL